MESSICRGVSVALGESPTCLRLALLLRGVLDTGRVRAQSLFPSLRHLWHGAVPSCMHLSLDRLHVTLLNELTYSALMRWTCLHASHERLDRMTGSSRVGSGMRLNVHC